MATVGLRLRPTELLVDSPLISNPPAAHDVAFVDVQVRTICDPAATLIGTSDPLTFRSAVGALMVTVAGGADDTGFQSGDPEQDTE